MEIDFVSEVDRKFFANNMLSNEDWEASMELSEIMERDTILPTPDCINDFSDDFQLLMEGGGTSFFPNSSHDDFLNDWSDSSDSGVSGLIGVQSPDQTIKSEPLSPTSSHHSDSGDSAISQATEQLQMPIPPPTDHYVDTGVPSPAVPAEPVMCIKEEVVSPAALTYSLPVTSDPSVNIHSILNSKVKIQPKPGTCAAAGTTDPVSPKKTVLPAPTAVGSQKSLVLTPEEFQRLTNQGVLRFQPPKQESVLKSQPVVSSKPVPCPPTQTLSFLPSHSSFTTTTEDKDTKIMKRQQRMIKNRESASLSRKRKKEYMSSLEQRLAEYGSENDNLRQENQALKRKLTQLNLENEGLRKTFSVSMPVVKKTCLLAVFVVLSLNLGSWSGILPTAPSSRSDLSGKLSVPVVHKGRQLLSLQSEESDQQELHEDTLHKLHQLILEYGGGANFTDVHPMCSTYFNKTESMRLAEQLAGWMYNHEKEKTKGKTKVKKQKQLRPISTLKRVMKENMNAMDRKTFRSMEASYQLQLFEGADNGRDFLKAIHRRNDTFYVLSFNEDYYLVPAVLHNKTSRPRMSLVMPAVALNESMMPPDGKVGMMQIDCEVMNTQLIHVRRSAIPKHARERYNSSQFEKNPYVP